MVEAHAMRGPFAGWTRMARDDKVRRLAEVIHRFRPFPTHCSVSRAKFDEFLGGVGPYELRDPYFICFYGVIHSLARWNEQQGITQQIEFIFDDQGPAGSEAALWYDYLRNAGIGTWKGLLGSAPQFRDDKQALPLQAADMFAWHARRQTNPRFARRHGDVWTLISGDERLVVTLPDETLLSMRDKMRAVPGIEHSRDKRGGRARAPELRRRLAAGLGSPTRSERFRARLKLWLLWIRPTYARAKCRTSVSLISGGPNDDE